MYLKIQATSTNPDLHFKFIAETRNQKNFFCLEARLQMFCPL